MKLAQQRDLNRMLRRSVAAWWEYGNIGRCFYAAQAQSKELKNLEEGKGLSGDGVPELPSCSFVPPPYTGPSKEEVMRLRQKFLNPAIFHHFKNPVMITDGHMQYLFDETGRRYLDAFAGIVTVSVGHCHPKVLKAVREQQDRLQVRFTLVFCFILIHLHECCCLIHFAKFIFIAIGRVGYC